MSFASLEFLPYLAVVVALFLFVPARLRTLALLVASYVFYLAAEPWHGALLAGSTVVDYFVGLGLGRTTAPALRKASTIKAGEKEIRGSWDGVSDRLTGVMQTDFSGATGKVTVRQTNGDLTCEGSWKYVEGKYYTAQTPRGEWQANCSNGETLSGTYASGSPGVGRIIGSDSQGREVELYF